ncbi:MAG: tRNA adenosine(34) deaminase TadA [Candidatus Cloacimonetes bacterium]|jgi:tRNA(adenine34) deaminase|nr:tRNA adenosine(34) deaminase TadA [Candidatus Cloacimonadota bacterium]MCK9184482.1 tRNA adenosine(34) deaminase TadA [Candidatus Cloacimonadota bacterium]MCK9583347.1 tRNA adenosine(34) deaminase TadA [Candidatus Cloacimonadota bacterium]
MNDEYFMSLALAEAKAAAAEDEIPVGACLVRDGIVILKDHNRTRAQQNPLAHCEKLILDEAQKLGLKYLQDCTLYVTLEPCLMCSGMIIHSRVGRVVYGAPDPKTGACGSVYQTLLDKSFNHHPELAWGVLAQDCALVLTDFFQNKR